MLLDTWIVFEFQVPLPMLPSGALDVEPDFSKVFNGVDRKVGEASTRTKGEALLKS